MYLRAWWIVTQLVTYPSSGHRGHHYLRAKVVASQPVPWLIEISGYLTVRGDGRRVQRRSSSTTTTMMTITTTVPIPI